MAEKIRNEASSSNNKSESVVVDFGRRKSSCGYCKSGGPTSISHGLWADSITVDDYQDLLDRGWRRSGSFLYKPEMERTCCPSYTIRLKAGDFAQSKEQLRVTRRMQRFLDGALDVRKSNLLTDEPSTSKDSTIVATGKTSSPSEKEFSTGNGEEKNKEEQYIQDLSNQIDSAVHKFTESGEFPSDIQLPKASIKKVTNAKRKVIEGSEDLLYSSNISFQIVAAVRRSCLEEKKVLSNQLDQNMQFREPSPNIVAEKIACSLNQLENFSDLSVKACNGHLNFYSTTRQVSSDAGAVIPTQSPRCSGSKRCCMEMKSENPKKKGRKLEINLKRSSFDPEEYDLYRRYQIKVHKDKPDKVTEGSYRRFLVDTPIVFVPPSGDRSVPPCGFGSFHQQYVIDGQLVAVGVVDILPRCLSSKYLFWDPDFAFLSLGKYSAVQEIGWVKQNQVHCPSLQHYYLGYYIHSCSKMRYKAAYRPSELLCPLRYQWVPFDIARPLLDKKPYVILSDFASLQNGESSPFQLLENPIEPQNNDHVQDDLSNILSDDDEEMVEPNFEGSDSDSGPETRDVAPADDEIKDGDTGNILIGLKGLRLRFKDVQHAFDSSGKNYSELQLHLHRYMNVVGPELSERMVYSL